MTQLSREPTVKTKYVVFSARNDMRMLSVFTKPLRDKNLQAGSFVDLVSIVGYAESLTQAMPHLRTPVIKLESMV